MPREHSIRFRLTVWYALILFAALGVFSGLIWLSLRQRLLSEVDRDLSDRATRFQTYMTRESAEVPPENLKDGNGGILPGTAVRGLSGDSGCQWIRVSLSRSSAGGGSNTDDPQGVPGGPRFFPVT